MSIRHVALALIGATLALQGCGGDISTPLAPGLTPLDVNTAPAPAAVGSDLYPETITFNRGETDSYQWVHARAYVHAPLTVTWAALRDPDTCTDRRRVASWTTIANNEPEYPFSYLIHNVVHDIVTVEFDQQWRHGVTAGTVADPQSTLTLYQKTSGSSFIEILRGSVIARQVDQSTTALEFIRQLHASGSGPDDEQTYLGDYFNSILAKVRGQPLPTYN